MANPSRVRVEDGVSGLQEQISELFQMITVGSNPMAQQGNVTSFAAPYNPFAGSRSMPAQNLASMGGGPQFRSANWLSFDRGVVTMGRSMGMRVTTHSSSAVSFEALSFSAVSFSSVSLPFLPTTSTPNASTSGTGTAAEDHESPTVVGRRRSKAPRYRDQCRTARLENQQNTDDDDGSGDRMEVDIPLRGAKRKRNETV